MTHMQIITNGDGQRYEVVQGTLDQDELYYLWNWQPHADEIEDEEVNFPDREMAYNEVLKRHSGREVVLLRRLVAGPSEGYCEGIERVVAWNQQSDGTRHMGLLVMQRIRHSREFYEHRAVQNEENLVAAEELLVQTQNEIDRIDGIEALATNVAALKDLNKPEHIDGEPLIPARSPIQKRDDACVQHEHAEKLCTELPLQIAGNKADCEAWDTLPDDFPTAHQIAEIRNPDERIGWPNPPKV